MININIVKNKYGFYEVGKKPSNEELKEYYSKKYYQNEKGAYQKNYDKDELIFFNNKIEQRFEKINDLISTQSNSKKMLDIGCGEGFTLNFFKKNGWDVLGVDFSDFGCKANNPDCLDNIIVGDIFDETSKLIANNNKFDVVIMQNLLEHVIDPEKLIIDLKSLLFSNSLLVITVPNDFSPIQKIALEKEKISETFWVVYPDHLSYFNKEGLKNLFEQNGYETMSFMTDFPIDIFLPNDNSNYIKDKTRGKQAHKARLLFENLIHNISINKVNNLYEAMANIEIGRDITGIFRLI